LSRQGSLCHESLFEIKTECIGDYETLYFADVSGLHHDNVILFSDENKDEEVDVARRLFLDNIDPNYRDPHYSTHGWFPSYVSFLAEKILRHQNYEKYYGTIAMLVLLSYIHQTAKVLTSFLQPVLAVDIRGEPRIYPVVVKYSEDGRVRFLNVSRLYMDEKTALEITFYGLAKYFDFQVEAGNEKVLDDLWSLRKPFIEELKRKHETAIKKALSIQDLKLDMKKINEILKATRASYLQEELQDWVEKAYTLEEKGRNLAYAILYEETSGTQEFFNLLDKVVEWTDNVIVSLNDIDYIGNNILTPDAVNYIDELIKLFTTINANAYYGMISENVWDKLRDLDMMAKRLVGRGVYWVTQKNFASLVNSATSAYHALIEYIQERANNRAIIQTSDPRAEELVATFFQTIEEAIKLGLDIKSFDLSPTYIVIRDNEIIMRLGSSSGHAAHLDIKEGVLRYYDTDKDVKYYLVELIDKFVPIQYYKITDEELVVHFEPTYENIRKLVAVMPLAISMDMRIEKVNTANFWTIVSEYLKKGDIDRILGIFEKLGISKNTVHEIARTLRKALASADENTFHEYIKENNEKFAKYLEELGKALKAHAMETAKTEKKTTASKNSRKSLAMTT